MTSVTIIGTGNMGGAIAGIAVKGGTAVQILGRDQQKVNSLAERVGGTGARVGDPITGDVVVLAVPFTAFDELASVYGSQLAGKVVVDVTNTVDPSTFDGLLVPADGSAAAVLAALVPEARVVKAFNTNFAATLSSGEVGHVPTTVVLAGDDGPAKDVLRTIITAGGLRVADVGSLKRAREMESLGFLQMVLAVTEQIGWTGGFAVQA